jgi:uncharacterized protein (TIRG00374 family)
VTASSEHSAPEREKPRSVLGTIIRVGLVALLIYLLWGIFGAIDWAQVVDAIAGLSAADWLRLVVLTAAYYVAESLILMAALPGMKLRHGLMAFLIPSAAGTVVPGPTDVVTRFAMYSQWGYSLSDTTASVMTSFVYANGTKIMLPVLGAVAVATYGGDTSEIENVAVLGAAVFIGAFIVIALVLRSERLAGRIGYRAGSSARRLAGPFNIDAPDDLAQQVARGFVDLRNTVGVLLQQRWYLGFSAALLAQMLLFGILLTSLRGVGITSEQLHWAEIFAAFTLVQVITIIPIMPGGLGIAEASYVSLLVVGSDRALVDTVTAGTLIYRLFSWLLIVPFGGIAFLLWRRSLPADDHVEP